MVDCAGGPRVNLIIYIDCVSPRITIFPNKVKTNSTRVSHSSCKEQLLAMAPNGDHPDAFPQNTIVVAVDNAQVAAPCLSLTKETPSDARLHRRSTKSSLSQTFRNLSDTRGAQQ